MICTPRYPTVLRRFSWLRAAALVSLTWTLITPGRLEAFALGELRVLSALGEPFLAEIPLSLAPDETAKTLEKTLDISIAPPSDYQVMELPRSMSVTDLTLKLAGTGQEMRVVVQGNQAVREPFFNLLVKSVMGYGAHYRAYRVFLDLPSTGSSRKMTATLHPKEASPSSLSSVPAAAASAPASSAASAPSVTGTADSTQVRATQYGPVKPHETLMQVANKVGIPPGMVVQQVMAAIWSANKTKFTQENMHGMPVGVVLELPSPEEIQRYTVNEARTLVRNQHTAWLNRTSSGTQRPPADVQQTKTTTAKPTDGAAPKPTDGAAPKPTDGAVPIQGKPAPALPKTQAQGKGVEYGLRLTVESAPKESPPQTSPQVDTSAPKPDAESDLSKRLADIVQQLKEMTDRFNETNQKLLKSEASRDDLRRRLTAANERVQMLEQAQLDAQWNWPLLGGSVGSGVLVAGAMTWWLRRRRKEPLRQVDPPVLDAHVSPEPLSVTPSSSLTLQKGVSAVGIGVGQMALAASVASLAGTRVGESGHGPGHTEAKDQEDNEEDLEEDVVEISGPIHLESVPSQRATRFMDLVSLDMDESPSFGAKPKGDALLALGGLPDEAAAALPFEGLEIGSELDEEMPPLENLESDLDLDEESVDSLFGGIEISHGADEGASTHGLEKDQEEPLAGGIEIGDALDTGLLNLFSLESGDDKEARQTGGAVTIHPGHEELGDLELIQFSLDLGSDHTSQELTGGVGSGAASTPSDLDGALEIVEFDLPDLDIETDLGSDHASKKVAGGGPTVAASTPADFDGGLEMIEFDLPELDLQADLNGKTGAR
ncbi:MAG: hypothetical protein H7839_11670 [Magnetococcus sp. YQC-5]